MHKTKDPMACANKIASLKKPCIELGGQKCGNNFIHYLISCLFLSATGFFSVISGLLLHPSGFT